MCVTGSKRWPNVTLNRDGPDRNWLAVVLPSYLFNPKPPGTAVRVNAEEAIPNSPQASATTQAMPATPIPTGVAVTPGDSEAALTWYPFFQATGYNVKYATTSGGPCITMATNTAATSYFAAGLSNGIAYYFVVSAVNGTNETANSIEVAAAPGFLSQNGWTASASASTATALYAIDGNLSTRPQRLAASFTGWFILASRLGLAKALAG